MPYRYACSSLLLILMLFGCEVADRNTGASPIEHTQWDQLLKKHSSPEGWVDYEGFITDSVRLASYLNLLRNHYPDPETWSKEERLAYWINAYNAFTVQFILHHYPVKSIKDLAPKLAIPMVNSAWDVNFINIEGHELTLNDIEHGILRKKFEEPRIHFAINCASKSCPNLLNEAYTAEKLAQQLQRQAIAFINDPTKNQLAENHVQISAIFDWFGGDFIKEQSLLSFLQQYSKTAISDDAKVDFLEYDWALNDKPSSPGL